MTTYAPSRPRRLMRAAAALAAIVAIALLGWRALRPTGEPDFISPAGHTISWPDDGTAAVWTSGAGPHAGPVAGPGGRRVVAIASVAKVMTALVVLADHPLAADDDGPTITVTAAEAADYAQEHARGESLVPVAAGEQLSEREALEALLLPSANNVARILARWDAGRATTFVARMNERAVRLGMRDTRYTDPSGFDPATVSTAVDQVRLGRAAMTVPAFAQVVALPSAEIPLAGRVANLDTLLGTYGIVGIKTGSTSAAGGCVLLAARQGSSLTVAAVLGRSGSAGQLLPRALGAGRALVASADGR